MSLLEQSVVEKLLVLELPVIAACVRNAWQDYRRYPVELRALHTPRSRASLIHDHMVDRAQREFGSNIDARCQIVGGLFVILFYDRLALRFKKLSDDYRSSNIPTQQSLDFVRQEFELPGYPTITNLQAGYRLNRLESDLDGIYVACPNGNRNHWIIDIDSTTKSDNVFDFPTTSVQRTTSLKLRDEGQDTLGEEDENT